MNLKMMFCPVRASRAYDLMFYFKNECSNKVDSFYRGIRPDELEWLSSRGMVNYDGLKEGQENERRLPNDGLNLQLSAFGENLLNFMEFHAGLDMMTIDDFLVKTENLRNPKEYLLEVNHD